MHIIYQNLEGIGEVEFYHLKQSHNQIVAKRRLQHFIWTRLSQLKMRSPCQVMDSLVFMHHNIKIKGLTVHHFGVMHENNTQQNYGEALLVGLLNINGLCKGGFTSPNAHYASPLFIYAIRVVDFKLCELRFVYEGGILWLQVWKEGDKKMRVTLGSLCR